jgi:hypothetical protein
LRASVSAFSRPTLAMLPRILRNLSVVNKFSCNFATPPVC